MFCAETTELANQWTRSQNGVPFLRSCFFFPTGGLTNPAYVRDDNDDDDDDEKTPVEPTLAETVLPWMRHSEEDVCQAPLKQREFPAWLKNEDYLTHGSPSNEMLGLQDGEGQFEIYSYLAIVPITASLVPTFVRWGDKEET